MKTRTLTARPNRSDFADAQRLRWMLAGHGYFMEEQMLCGHPPTSEDEQDAARREIDEAMTATPAPTESKMKTTRTPTTLPEFNTDDYEASHGHGPRGYGYWIFAVPAAQVDTAALIAAAIPLMPLGAARILIDANRPYIPHGIVHICINGTIYTEAKRAVRRLLRVAGAVAVTDVVVCS